MPTQIVCVAWLNTARQQNETQSRRLRKRNLTKWSGMGEWSHQKRNLIPPKVEGKQVWLCKTFFASAVPYTFVCCLFAFPSYISGVHHFGVRFLRMWPFFNPTIKVVTFRLRGWCVLGVFLLPAFTRLGHERQDLLSPCDEMHVCTDQTSVYTLIRRSFWGNGVWTHVNSKGKIPSTENVPRGGSNPRRCEQRAQALPTELFRPQLTHLIFHRIHKASSYKLKMYQNCLNQLTQTMYICKQCPLHSTSWTFSAIHQSWSPEPGIYRCSKVWSDRSDTHGRWTARHGTGSMKHQI